MKRIRVALCALWSAGTLFAGAVVEGVVTKAAGERIPTAVGRYKPTIAPIGKPDPLRAVVYLEGDFLKMSGVKQVEVGQRHYQFRPGILAVQTGTEVIFPNYDNEFHSVFSYSRPKRFDLGNYQKDDKPASQVFDKPGLVKLFCQIHPHMRGTILVLDTPHFTQTDPKTGAYRLENLPAGKFQLKAWLDEDKVLEKTVELKDGETVKIDFN